MHFSTTENYKSGMHNYIEADFITRAEIHQDGSICISPRTYVHISAQHICSAQFISLFRMNDLETFKNIPLTFSIDSPSTI